MRIIVIAGVARADLKVPGPNVLASASLGVRITGVNHHCLTSARIQPVKNKRSCYRGEECTFEVL